MSRNLLVAYNLATAAILLASAFGLGCRYAMRNHKPVIVSIKVNASVAAGDHVPLSCIASDPDHDPLTYRWSCDRGWFSGVSGASTTWTAPNMTGIACVTVMVGDGRGGSDVRTKAIRVSQAR